MGPKTGKLVTELETVISLLESCAVDHWADWFKNSKSLLENGDFSGIEQVLSAFGGMGSFNDLHICRANGHDIDDKDAAAVNQRLQESSGTIFDLANDIRKAAKMR